MSTLTRRRPVHWGTTPGDASSPNEVGSRLVDSHHTRPTTTIEAGVSLGSRSGGAV
jgi:hypothetical protein